MAGYWEKLSYIASKIATDALPLLTVFAVLSALFGVASWLSYSRDGRIVAKHNTLFVVAIAFIACVIGYTTTNSRTPILGEVLPLILTGLGALFGIGYVQSKIERSLLAVAVVVFSVAVFIGMTLGGVNRQAHETAAPRTTETAQGAQVASPTPQPVAPAPMPTTSLTRNGEAFSQFPTPTLSGGLIGSGSGLPPLGNLTPTPTPAITFGPTFERWLVACSDIFVAPQTPVIPRNYGDSGIGGVQIGGLHGNVDCSTRPPFDR